MLTFGSTLKQIRRGKNKTQREIANAAGMDYAYYSRLENDRHGFNPTKETVYKLTHALGCSTTETNLLLAAAGRTTDEWAGFGLQGQQDPNLTKLMQMALRLSSQELTEVIVIIEKMLAR